MTENAFFESEGAARSQASAAYRRLRADIVAGRYQAGQKLKIREVAQSLDVGTNAVREALSRLVPENLVRSHDQKGFVVAPLTINDLEELVALRCEVEGFALREAVARGDDIWEAGVVAAGHRLNNLGRNGDGAPRSREGWRQLHFEFHHALVRGCGNGRLVTLHTHLFEQSERYHVLAGTAESERNIVGEHQGLIGAALARDADLLVGRMKEHLRATAATVKGFVATDPQANGVDRPAVRGKAPSAADDGPNAGDAPSRFRPTFPMSPLSEGTHGGLPAFED